MARGGARNNAGKKPTPTHIKALKGTIQKCRENKDEPKTIPPKNTACPEWLLNNKEVVETWTWATGVLKESKVIAQSDMLIVEQFCLTYATLKLLWSDLSVEGYTITDYKGETKTNPKAKLLNNFLTQMRQFSALLGLDPANRARLKVNKDDKPKDGFEEMLKQIK